MFYITEALRLLIPLWIANSFLNILGIATKKYHLWDYPLDLKLNWFDKHHILGNSKTILGIPCALIGGYLGGIIVKSNLGLLLGFSAYFGTVISGFTKRRMGIKQSYPFWIIDQTDYILGTIGCFVIGGLPIKLEIFLVAALITIPVHIGTNIILYKLRIRRFYW